VFHAKRWQCFFPGIPETGGASASRRDIPVHLFLSDQPEKLTALLHGSSLRRDLSASPGLSRRARPHSGRTSKGVLAEKGAALAAPHRNNQGKKLGDCVGRKRDGAATLLLNRLLKETRAPPSSWVSESPSRLVGPDSSVIPKI
jgi:hypothetical protein